jgi:hypothetical protein
MEATYLVRTRWEESRRLELGTSGVGEDSPVGHLDTEGMRAHVALPADVTLPPRIVGLSYDVPLSDRQAGEARRLLGVDILQVLGSNDVMASEGRCVIPVRDLTQQWQTINETAREYDVRPEATIDEIAFFQGCATRISQLRLI